MKRLVILYPSITNRARGDRNIVRRFMKAAERKKRMELAITKTRAERGLILPAGISLRAVRGLSLSNLWSAYLLKPIAAFLAKTMHSNTRINKRHVNSFSPVLTAVKNPSRAKGMANTVWLNFTREK